MRARAVFALAAVALVSVFAEAQAATPELQLYGKLMEGGVVVGTAAPGAQVYLQGRKLLVDPEGRFVIGFDRDAAGDEALRIVWPSGGETDRTLTIAKRDYAIQKITGLPQKTVVVPPSEYPRIKREIKMKAAARDHDSKGSWFAEHFIWPAKGPISGVFGSQRIDNGVPKRPHFGVDIAAPQGAKIVAPAGGVVRLAQPAMYFEGGLVFIDHGHGLIGYMMHMSKVEVHKGEVVKQGQEIGRVGHTGRATGPHVHWGMYWFNAHVDPSTLVPPVGQPIALGAKVGGMGG
jgi:murein DD-endopeptidase MepM/ murein hydrolase activator NlpD